MTEKKTADPRKVFGAAVLEAARKNPDFSASASARSSMSPPRAVLIKTEFGFI